MCAKVGLCYRGFARIKRAVLVDNVRRLTYFPINDDLFGLSEEQKQFRHTAFSFAQKELALKASEIDKTDSFPDRKEFWKKCGSLGVLGMAVPAEYGGSPAGSIEMVLFQEEIARASAAIALSLGAHSGICMMPIAKYGTEEQKRKYLPKLCSGEHIGALALSEHHAGSDVVAMKTHATRKGDHYVLNGSKFWITNGPIADILVVYVKTDPSSKKPFRSISAFIIERGMKGFRTSPKLDKLGMRGSDTGELIFENCEVPVENLLGEPGQGVYTLMSGLDVERGMGASLCLGIMQACCDVAFKYAHEREAFGQKIGHFQMIQSKLADMYTRLVTARSLIYNISRAIDAHTIETQDCAAGILYAAESATHSALDTIQILGGNGYVNDYPAGRLLRDAKLMEIGAGTSEIRRLVIGRSINATYRS